VPSARVVPGGAGHAEGGRADGRGVGAQRRFARRPASARPARALPAVLALALAASPMVVPPSTVAALAAAPAAGRTCSGGSDLLAAAPVARRRPARGVAVRTWDGHDGTARGAGHEIRLSVAAADLRVVRLAAASGGRFGAATGTTQLTAAAAGSVVGVNGDYFGYDWSGAAVPYGPLVRGGRILRLPPGVLPVVGADAAGRPVAAGVRAGGSVAAGRAAGRWALPVLSVNDDGDGGRGRVGAEDPVAAGRGVAVVTPYLGGARPRRSVEAVVRRGVVVAIGRRLPFGAGAAWGSGRAGQKDVLLSAFGAAAAKLRGLRRGSAVTVRYAARFADGPAAGTKVRDGVGSGAVLMRGGQNLAPCAGSAIQSRPRTMIAWNARRTRLWLIVVTGRTRGGPSSRYGLTYRQVTEVARALGAAEAVMVDGGGSSTMAVRSGRRVHRVDAPAQVPQRPVPNAVVIVRR
jgi:hypothetical protein